MLIQAQRAPESTGDTRVNAVAVQYSPTNVKIQTFSSLEEAEIAPSHDNILWLDVSEFNAISELRPLEKKL